MSGVERAKSGRCGICANPLHHGPWTDEQIAEVVVDTGIDTGEFEDWCDDCFVQNITQGDVREASRLLGGRELRLRNPETAFRFLLGASA